MKCPDVIADKLSHSRAMSSNLHLRYAASRRFCQQIGTALQSCFR